MDKDEFAIRIEDMRQRLYKTAYMYMGNRSQALDVLDEAIYKALCNFKKLRHPEYFDTWITRILINECNNELCRQKRFYPIDEVTEKSDFDFDSLPLKEAILNLPKDLKDVVILRYFSGFTIVETAKMLKIPQGTAATRQRKALKLLKLELEEAEK